MAKIERLYNNSEEQYIKTFVTYADTSDAVVCYDEDCENEVPKAELINMFNKGMVINYDGQIYTPVSLKVETTKATVGIVTTTTAETVTTVAVTLLESATEA